MEVGVKLSLRTFLLCLCAACSCDSTVAGPADGGDEDGGMDAPDFDSAVDANGEDAGDDANTPDGGMDDAGPMMDAMMCNDVDGDGVTDCDGDCDDDDPLTYPGAPEVCGDGVDNACGSDPDPASLCSGVGTHVSPAGDDSTGDGTRENPVRTITQGIANAVSIGGSTTVVVAGGDYNETVTVVEGVSITGGFDCPSLPCSWNHDPSSHTSTVDGGGSANAVEIDDTITRATTISHLSLRSGRDGVSVRGGAPTLRTLNIDARTGMSAFGAGTDPLLENSTVLGMNAGVTIEGSGEIRSSDIEGSPGLTVRGSVLVEDNVIHAAGDSGMTIWEGNPQILANVINEDGTRVGTCGFGFCAGIAIWGGSPYIANNVVYGMGGDRSASIAIVHGELVVERPIINSNTLYASRTAGSGSAISAGVTCESFFGIAMFGEIRNNIVIGASAGQSFGFYEEDNDPSTTCRPVMIETNLFSGIDHVARFFNGGDQFFTAVADADAEAWATSNQAGDPMLDANHRLMAGSPAIDMGVATDAPSVDRDGDARPAGGGYDIGADERP